MRQMDSTSILKFVLLILLNASVTDADVYKIDVTTLDPSPLVGTSSGEKYYTYLSRNYRDANFDKIGRYENTGTGDVGTGYENPQNGDTPPLGTGFPEETETIIDYTDARKRLEVKFTSLLDIDRIGVFYSTVSKDGDTLTIPTIKMSQSADIKPVKYTTSVSIGDTAHLSVITDQTNLRWVHNNGDVISNWNDATNVTIDNVRLADAGIYECYEEGKRGQGTHAIMRLIVRECPGPKYGANCSETCNTCWNGGICAADDGTCLCQPGFSGTLCGQLCGNSKWGAFCSLGCGSSETGCIGRLICGPDPIGCSCAAGYTVLDCNEPCSPGFYGANCDQECHCPEDQCDASEGCTEGGCDDGYGTNRCQGHDNCTKGLYGEQCQYKCHCNGGEACDQTTGMCINDSSCAQGWAGSDCQQALPALFRDPRIVSIGGLNVTIDWDDWDQMIDYGNGPVESYILHYGIEGCGLMSRVEATDSNTTLLNLQSDTTYEFAVAAIKFLEGVMEEGKLGNIISGTTHCLAPTKHPNFTEVAVVDQDSVILEWTIPEGDEWFQCSNLSDFIITYRHKDSTSYNETRVPSTNLSVTISALNLCTMYEFEIRATNKHAQGMNSPPVYATIYVAPGNITSLQATPLSPASINIQWTAPRQSVCNITSYIVYHNLTLLDQCLEMSDHATNLTTATSLTLHNLQYFSSYTIGVQARSGDKSGPTEQTYVQTAETVPTGQPTNVTGRSSVKQQLTYTWDPPDCGKRRGVIVLYEYQFGKNVSGGSYTSGSTTSTNWSFTGLSHNTLYEFRVRAKTTEGDGPYTDIYATRSQESGKSDNITAVAVSISVVLVVVVVILLGAVLFRKRRKDNSHSSETSKHEHSSKSSEIEVPKSQKINIAIEQDTMGESCDTAEEHYTTSPATVAKPEARVKPIIKAAPSKHDPVNVADLFEYVKRKKINAPYHEFRQDFQTLPEDQQDSWEVSTRRENKTKNRYKNIITYDHSRVVLELIDGKPYSDYINATYMHGYRKEKAYIASQGPNSVTINDMWRMIWQEQSCTIVMATSLIEGGKQKCEQYWPNVGSVSTYGDIYVTNMNEEKCGNFVIRNLHVTKNAIYANQAASTDEIRQIKQFHFTNWPDMGVPEFAEPLLKFIDEVNTSNPSDAGPIVIHCSAGVGRTGSIITIDTMMKMARSEGKVDIFNFIHEMRKRRTMMVQTEVQYVFVHDAILEALSCGNTTATISTPNLEQAWIDMNQTADGTEDCYLVNQYKTLDSTFPPISAKRYSGGRKPESIKKNRYKDMIPPDFARPYLMSTENDDDDGGGNNYINAAFCHGYRKDNLYLATQVPLPDTTGDLWCMVYDYQCQVIIALNDPEHLDQQNCGVYIPDSAAIQCGRFTVEYVDQERSQHTTETTVRLYHSNSKTEARRVKHIQYTDWKNNATLPNSKESFLQLLNRTERSIRDNDDMEEQRIVVICLNGVSRCGVFCAVKSIIDQIKDEQQLNVFRAVKRLKMSRHEMVNTLEEYALCYESARSYLSAFETYANLK